MLRRRVEQLLKAFYNGDSDSFELELEVIRNRAQLSDREIYNSLKSHLERDHWPKLRGWIFDSDMSAKGE
ncbi:MAG: hypothetical protein CME37_19670 [Haliea sp.]|jgi:hypothetical protein|nr:hypothetical protein [Haliea sp.]